MAEKGEKRVDPDDGIAYTFDELASYYKGKFKKQAIQQYWETQCSPLAPVGQAKSKAKAKAKDKAKSKAKEETAPKDQADVAKKQTPTEKSVVNTSSRPGLKRTKSWLVKVGGITLLPCEDSLAPLIEDFQARREAGDTAGMDVAQLRVLEAHPFVTVNKKAVQAEALAAGISCEAANYKMSVDRFKKWLRTPAGKPFEEKGKGYDDGCYLTSAVLRSFMPRGFTVFSFSNGEGSSASVILRGFLKFTGLTATDEDEESGATSEVDSFMFHGYSRQDATRFAVTTKSNGENGKYTFRQIFGDWYGFAGSKNTGVVWKVGSDLTALYPIPADSISSVGPKIVHQVAKMLGDMSEDQQAEFLKTIDASVMTVMIELNDPEHEHIFPIHTMWADHVAILNNAGYPLPQKEARAFFDKFGLKRVTCDVHDEMNELEAVMDQIRSSTDTEGAVIYLERNDDKPIGLVKVKSDHYVIARRTRETVRGLVVAADRGEDVGDALKRTHARLTKGMQELKHVRGCNEKHKQWAEFACAFAGSWAAAFSKGNASTRKALVAEYHGKYGSMYENFWSAWQRGEKDAKPILRLSTPPPDTSKGAGRSRKSGKGKNK